MPGINYRDPLRRSVRSLRKERVLGVLLKVGRLGSSKIFKSQCGGFDVRARVCGLNRARLRIV